MIEGRRLFATAGVGFGRDGVRMRQRGAGVPPQEVEEVHSRLRAVSTRPRMWAKRSAPARVRKQPEIFIRGLVMRRARSAPLRVGPRSGPGPVPGTRSWHRPCSRGRAPAPSHRRPCTSGRRPGHLTQFLILDAVLRDQVP